MPKPIKKKIVKKTTSGTDASGTLSRLKKSAEERKRFLITALAAVVLSVIAIGGFFLYSNTQKNKAQKLEYEAYKIYYGLYQKQPVASEERYKKAAEIFKKAYDVRKSPVSLYYIANCYYELGEYEESLNALKDLNRKFPDDEKFVPLSYYK
ncbi:MAG: tetratricopeptide repeat protein, partial [Nitrospirae bacterium]|nr:tetratricopeptide repeat protein [Nitrospirota bacterium]